MGARALSATLLGCLSLAAPAEAAGPPRLSLQVKACAGAAPSASELERSLRTELEADALVQLSDRNAEATLVAEVACDAALSTTIRLRATRSQRQSERSIVLADANPSARAGVLALAAAELVRSDLSELTSAESRGAYPSDSGAASDTATEPSQPAQNLASAEPPAPQPVALKPAASLPELDHPARPRDRAPRAAQRAWSVSADARLRWFPDYASVSWGGAAGADLGAWRLRAEALLSAPGDSLGSAALGSAAACVGYRLVDERWGALRVAVYPQVAAGVTWIRGSTTQVGVSVSPATGLYADARLVSEVRVETASLSPSLALELGRATGYVARSAGRAVGATGGFFVGASAGGTY